MKLYSNVYEVRQCVRCKKKKKKKKKKKEKNGLPFFVSELLPFDYFFHPILMRAITR